MINKINSDEIMIINKVSRKDLKEYIDKLERRHWYDKILRIYFWVEGIYWDRKFKRRGE